MIPRQPTRDELEELERYIYDHVPAIDHRVVFKYSASNAIAVFDEYRTDDGSYRGKVMVVVWPDGPAYQQVFIWDGQGRLELVPQAAAVAG